MARTALAATAVNRDGVGLTASQAAANVDGNAIAAHKDLFLAVTNGSGASIDVTFLTPGTVDAEEVAESITAVAAGVTALIAVPYGRIFQQTADDKRVWVDYSAVATVTVALFELDN